MKKAIYITSLLVIFLITSYSEAMSSQGWYARIVAKGGYEFTSLYLGASTINTDGYENSDSPGYPDGYLKAYFYEPTWPLGEFYWGDYRSVNLPQTWTVNIIARYRSAGVDWDIAHVPSTIDMFITDEATGTRINMRDQIRYEYASTSYTEPRVFTIEASGYYEVLPEEEEVPLPEEEVPADTTPPETLIETILDEYISSTEVEVLYSASDNLSAESALQYSFSLDGSDWSAWSTTTSTVFSDLTDGVHSVEVISVDEAGNIDLSAATINFSVDTMAPALYLGVPTPAVLWPPVRNKMVTVTAQGSATDSGSGLSSISYQLVDEYGKYSSLGTLAVAENGSFVFSSELESWRNGTDLNGRIYHVTVTATDNLGNQSTRVLTVTSPREVSRK